ncbi:MAG: 16S rRNA (guanine966-N2)-methyltransferase [Pseudohongiellaceae bacterium]
MPKKNSPRHALTKAPQRGLGAGQLRIIGGCWRGRKLPIIDADGLRPTSDRIRETLFNWLAPAISDSVCLDLFSGSGALSFECLSRGALQAIMIEKNPLIVNQLKHNSVRLQSVGGVIIQQDAIAWLVKQQYTQHTIDIAFIDPPFAYNLWESVIDRLHRSRLLAPNALIYIESPRTSILTTPAPWQLCQQKTAGEVTYRLYKNRLTVAS